MRTLHSRGQAHDAAAQDPVGHRRYILPEIDLGGGYSVAYTDGEDSMDIDVELARLADAVNSTNRALGMPAPAISFEPGRYIVAPAA